MTVTVVTFSISVGAAALDDVYREVTVCCLDLAPNCPRPAIAKETPLQTFQFELEVPVKKAFPSCGWSHRSRLFLLPPCALSSGQQGASTSAIDHDRYYI